MKDEIPDQPKRKAKRAPRKPKSEVDAEPQTAPPRPKPKALDVSAVVTPPKVLPHEMVRRLARARQQALTEWHRTDLTLSETAWRDAARTTGEILPQVLQRLNLEQRLAESQILQVWDRVLDRTITAHAKPVGLRKGTLFVTVDSNVWLSELVRYRYREILEKLQLTVGPDKVVRLSLRVG